MAVKKIVEEAREIEVKGEYDVLVIGAVPPVLRLLTRQHGQARVRSWSSDTGSLAAWGQPAWWVPSAGSSPRAVCRNCSWAASQVLYSDVSRRGGRFPKKGSPASIPE